LSYGSNFYILEGFYCTGSRLKFMYKGHLYLKIPLM